MKRTKKMLALVLALMMAFTCLAMPAMAAAEDEGIMPLGLQGLCPIHGEYEQVRTYSRDDYITTTCSAHLHTEHTHHIVGTEYRYACGFVHHASDICMW